jgi:hypothetical protein
MFHKASGRRQDTRHKVVGAAGDVELAAPVQRTQDVAAGRGTARDGPTKPPVFFNLGATMTRARLDMSNWGLAFARAPWGCRTELNHQSPYRPCALGCSRVRRN